MTQRSLIVRLMAGISVAHDMANERLSAASGCPPITASIASEAGPPAVQGVFHRIARMVATRATRPFFFARWLVHAYLPLPAILFLGGCTIQNLVGNLNVGLGGADAPLAPAESGSDGGWSRDNPAATPPCYRPLPAEAKAELGTAGYPAKFPALADWLAYQGSTIRPTHEDCDEAQAQEDNR